MNMYVLISIKFFLGILATILQINILGKYEFSANTPLNQIQNFVLGGIIGGVIYNSSISILTFIIILLIWSLVVIVVKLLINNKFVKSLVVGNPMILIKMVRSMWKIVPNLESRQISLCSIFAWKD
ncbi:putative membrane protein yetF [Streptococcus sp. HSISB1]|nr:putative membrane protein yetF [Streptococcus sp. HSISB1]